MDPSLRVKPSFHHRLADFPLGPDDDDGYGRVGEAVSDLSKSRISVPESKKERSAYLETLPMPPIAVPNTLTPR